MNLPPYQLPIAVVLLTICAALLAFLVWSLANGMRAARWPETEGVIEHSSMEAEDEGYYRSNIVFRYKVGEVDYSGSRLRFGREAVVSRSTSKVKGILADYPKGARVVVRYDPRRPSVSVLQTGVSGAIIFGFGAVALISVNSWNLLVGNVVLK